MAESWEVGETRFLGLRKRPALALAAVLAGGVCAALVLLVTGVIPFTPLVGILLGFAALFVLAPIGLFSRHHRSVAASIMAAADDPRRRW